MTNFRYAKKLSIVDRRPRLLSFLTITCKWHYFKFHSPLILLSIWVMFSIQGRVFLHRIYHETTVLVLEARRSEETQRSRIPQKTQPTLEKIFTRHRIYKMGGARDSRPNHLAKPLGFHAHSFPAGI